MNKLSLFLLALSLAFNGRAQEFQFTMHFEDAAGHTDSVILGYDVNATATIDPEFGEQDILGVPLDSAFEVRISDVIFYEDHPSFQSKKQILADSCGGWYFPIVSIEMNILAAS